MCVFVLSRDLIFSSICINVKVNYVYDTRYKRTDKTLVLQTTIIQMYKIISPRFYAV